MWRTIPTCLLASFLFASMSAAQELSPWVGRKVVTKSNTPLKAGNRTIDEGRVFRVYKVEQVEGDCLLLAAGTVLGWVRTDDVVSFDQAIDYFTQQIRSNPDSSPAYVRRGLVWSEKGETDIAIADYSEAIRLEPRVAEVYLDRGSCWDA